MMRRIPVLVVVSMTIATGSASGADGPPSPEESRSALRLADPTLTIELVASEPAVVDPVAIAWDEFGRLYVAEMSDYPVGPVGGRIKRLEDRDGDGRFEHAEVFAEGLPYPSGLLPWSGGLLVTAAPDLLFLKDGDGDGRAEIREVVLTGFGEGNQQLRVNSPTWGIDNRVYLANGRSGGAVRRPGDSEESAVAIPRNDLRLDPSSGTFEPVSGFSQFGLPRDDWGDRFPSWNTVPVRHVVRETGGAGGVAEILDLGDGGRIYSLAPAQQRFNAESAAFFNATCGPIIERGGLLGEDFLGNAFVCEPLTGVVHRRRLVPDGSTYRALRVEQGEEFLASAHSWFRPVNLANGPDGALYVVDFCRAWVEHPAFVPEGRRDEVDFAEGRDRGRIWRIAPSEVASQDSTCRPGALTTIALVSELTHSNGWCRDTAQRLLVERSDPSAVAPLQEMARRGPGPLARVHALWTLDGLEALDDETLRSVLADAEPRVREAATRLAEGREGLVSELARLADDADARVRLRAAEALGGLSDDRAIETLARIAARDAGSPWTTSAVLDGVGGAPLAFLEALVRLVPAWQEDPSPDQARFLAELADRVGGRDSEAELAALLRRIAEVPGESAAFAMLLGLARGQERLSSPRLRWEGSSGGPLGEAVAGVGPIRIASVDASSDGDRPAWVRALALEAALATKAPGVGDRLLEALEPGEPAELQAVSARGVARFATPEQADRLLDGWDRSPLATRRLLLGALASREALADRLLEAVERGAVPPAELDPTTREALGALGGDRLEGRLEALLRDEPAVDRGEVVRRFGPSLALEPDPDRGRALFAQHCRNCHARDGVGAKVGPDLIGLVGRPAEDLLASILDPSRDVPPDGLGVVVATTDGQILTGLLVEETPEAVRLRLPEGLEEAIPRGEVEALRPTGRSLMPEGFEQVLAPQDLADLIAALRLPDPEPAASP